MTLRKIGKLRRSTVVSLAALAVATGAFAVALTAAAGSQSAGHELSARLVPAASAANELLTAFNAQQGALRYAVASGPGNGLAPDQADGAQLLRIAATASALARGDRPMTAHLTATMAAYRGWLARVAVPEVRAVHRGDFPDAQAIQADLPLTVPAVLAVRTAGLALQSEVTGEQRAVTSSLSRLYDTQLAALIVMIMVIASIAVFVIVDVRRSLLGPFRALNAAVAAVADGRYATRVPAVGAAELADLSRGVERMRTRLVEALREQERARESMRSVFDLAPDAMVAVAADGTITMANAQAVRLYGYSVEELIGRKVNTLLPEEWRSSMAAESARYLGDRRSRPPAREGEMKSAGLRRDGTTFPSEVRLSLLPSADGTLVVAAVRDITERLAMEAEQERLRLAAEQERLQQRLQQSRRLESLGQLVGGVAHDFNNLLNVIAGYTDFTAEQLAQLAAEDDRIVPVLADVEQVRTAAQQAIRVTRQLLTFARSEEASREVLSLNDVVESAGQLLRRSLGERIQLIVSTQPDLWPVEADRGQLEQVLVNVALNARDAMPGGGRLSIESGNAEVDAAFAAQRPALKPGRYCRLAVSDTGTGMDQATIDRVFEPFFSTKPRGRGTGLGLATVYGIVTGLGGTIDIYSEKGLGTTVSVLLPVTEQPAAHAAEPAPAPAEDIRGQGETILLVEDEESLRAMTSRILARNGYLVVEAADGAAAVRHAGDPDQHIDLLLTDMVMPGMLGIEVAARTRSARPRLPALFISGYAQQVLDFHGIPAQEHDILQKPFTEADLLRRVHQALRRLVIPPQQAAGLDVSQERTVR